MGKPFKIPKKKQGDNKESPDVGHQEDNASPSAGTSMVQAMTRPLRGGEASSAKRCSPPLEGQVGERGRSLNRSPRFQRTPAPSRKRQPPTVKINDDEEGPRRAYKSSFQETSKKLKKEVPKSDFRKEPVHLEGTGQKGLLGLIKSSEQDPNVKTWAATGSRPRAQRVESTSDLARLRREAKAEQEKLTKIGPEGELVIYTDGGCWRNGASDARAAIGVYFGRGSRLNVSETVRLRHRQTNNSAELLAAEKAVRVAVTKTTYRRICLVTDSNLLVRGWKSLPFWQKNGWRTVAGKPVRNRREFKLLQRIVAMTPGCTLRIVYVKGHSDSEGNNAADALAAAAIHRFVKELNESAWAADPGCRPIRYNKSMYGEPPYVPNHHQMWSDTQERNRQLAEIDLARHETLHRMRKNPALASKAAQLSQAMSSRSKQVDLRQKLEEKESSPDLRAKIDAKAKPNDLRNKLVIRRKTPLIDHPSEDGQHEHGKASVSMEISFKTMALDSGREVKPLDTVTTPKVQVKPEPKVERKANGKKTQKQFENERAGLERDLCLTAELPENDLRKDLIITQLTIEEQRANRRREKNKRRNDNKRIKTFFNHLNCDINAKTVPVDPSAPIEWPEEIGLPSPEEYQKMMRAEEEKAKLELLHGDPEIEIRTDSPESINLVMETD